MLTLMVVAVLAAGPEVRADAVEANTDPQWSVQLRLGLPTLTLVSTGGLGGVAGVGVVGGLGGLGGLVPPTGLLVEHALAPHWAVTLGADAGGAAVGGAQLSLQAGLSPGVRWYAQRVFDGPWAGAQLNVGGAWSAATFADASGATTTARSAGYTVTPDLLLGWTLRLGDRFLASVAAGPSLRWTRLSSSFGGQTSSSNVLTTGVHASGAVGLTF